MICSRVACALVMAALAQGTTTAANAASVLFTGSVYATGGVGPDASCAPLPLRATILPVNSSGSSNLGSFSYGHTLCTAGGPGPFAGDFTVTFGADSFAGTFTGLATPSGTAGLINEAFVYSVTGGTGRFLGSSGSFTGNGTLDARQPPPQLALDFDGTLNLPAVPEPASWALLLVGFGFVGSALRRTAGFASAA